MKRTWRTLTIAGSLSLAALAAPAQDDAPQAPAESTPETPIKARTPAQGEALPRTFGPTEPLAPPALGVAAPSVVGDYRVGEIHDPPLAHLFWYSGFNPYLDEMHRPFRQVTYGGAHARYYAGYRNVYAPNWHEFYVPRYYAPAAYGYDAYGPSYYGYGQTRSSFYGPVGAPVPGGVATPVPPAPPSGFSPSGFRYTGDPGVFSPFGAGSSSYFGAYGSAGY